MIRPTEYYDDGEIIGIGLEFIICLVIFFMVSVVVYQYTMFVLKIVAFTVFLILVPIVLYAIGYVVAAIPINMKEWVYDGDENNDGDEKSEKPPFYSE